MQAVYCNYRIIREYIVFIQFTSTDREGTGKGKENEMRGGDIKRGEGR